MENKILSICCFAGILAGFIIPYFYHGISPRWLLVFGMAGGLLIGMLLDRLINGPEKKQ